MEEDEEGQHSQTWTHGKNGKLKIFEIYTQKLADERNDHSVQTLCKGHCSINGKAVTRLIKEDIIQAAGTLNMCWF